MNGRETELINKKVLDIEAIKKFIDECLMDDDINDDGDASLQDREFIRNKLNDDGYYKFYFIEIQYNFLIFLDLSLDVRGGNLRSDD